MSAVEERLQKAGFALPEVATPAGSYVPALQYGNLVYTSGQIPLEDGELKTTGKLGAEVALEEGHRLAQVCVLNALAAAREVIGDLDRVERVVKVVGFVSSEPGFFDQPKVINGASDLLGEVFGPEVGAHARSAVGVAVLPLNVPVEVELILAVRN